MADDYDEFDDITTEERARAMGWKPRAEYKGDPRRWTDADEFIAHGEAELPILRDQNRRMSEKLVKFEHEVGTLRNTVAEQTAAIHDAMQLARRADDAGYTRGLAELKARQREAASVGDTEAFDQIEDQIEAAQAERAAGYVTSSIPATPPPPPQAAPETVQFLADNPWFNEKTILKNAMIAAHQEIMSNSPNMPLAQQYAQAKAEVIESFPQFFPEEYEEEVPSEPSRPRPRLRAQPLSPTNGAAHVRPGGRSPFEKIADPADRAEARAAYANIAKYDPEATEEEYVTLYLNPKTDVLALRARRGRSA